MTNSPWRKILGRLVWIGSAKTFSSAIAHTLVSRFGSLLLNTAMGIVIARLLGPVGRGEIGAINLWPTVMCGLLTLGVPIALRFEIRRRLTENPRELFTVALLLSSLLGVVAAAIGIFALPHWLVHYSPELVRFAQLMMLFAPQIMLQLTVQGFLESRGDFVQSNRITYIPQAVTLLSLVVLHFANYLSSYTAALAYATPPLIVTITSLFRVRTSIVMPRNVIVRCRQLLHYGVRAYGLDVLATLSAQIDQALVIELLSASSFGLYVVALNISRALVVFSQSLNSVLFPRATSLEPKDAVALVARSARLIFACTAVAGVLFAAILPLAITVAYGRAFSQDIVLTRILTCEVVLSATVSTLAQAFMATGRPGLVTILQALGLATTVPLMLILIPRLGLSGAAFALLGSSSLRLALVLISYPLFLQQKMPRLFLNMTDLRYLYTKIRPTAS